MSERRARLAVGMPPEVYDKLVITQRVVEQETGFRPSLAQVARHLIEVGFAANTQYKVYGVSSGPKG